MREDDLVARVGTQRVVDNEVHSHPARLVRVVKHGLWHGLNEIRIHGMRRVDEDYRLLVAELCPDRFEVRVAGVVVVGATAGENGYAVGV
jgi:hypothetical protein